VTGAISYYNVKHVGSGADSTYYGLTLPDARERAADIVRSQGEALTDDRAVLADYGYLAAEDSCLDIDPGDGRAEVALADGSTIWVWRS
jgi:hypothetical protein